MSATSQEQVCPARGFDGSAVLIGVRSGTINGGRRAACCADDPPHDIGAATMGERMQGKTALVTGATSNIGRAIAIAFAAEGANVVVSGRSASRGGEVVQEIRRAGGHAQFVAADLDGSARASRELSTAALDALGGRLDVLVNSAGIFPGSTTPTVDEAMFDEVYAVNVKAPFFLTAAINDRPRIVIDHQPRLLGGPIGNPRRRAVCINEGGDGDSDPGLGRGVRVAGRARQRDLSRCRAHWDRERSRYGDDARDAVRGVRHAGRDRTRSGSPPTNRSSSTARSSTLTVVGAE